MKRTTGIILAVVLIMVICAATISCKSEEDTADTPTESFGPEVERQIEEAVERNLRLYGGDSPVPGVVVGIWAPGRGTYVKGIGKSDIVSGEDMDTADKFRVGSNTKTFVVTVLLQLVDEGKLSLDDTLDKFDLGVAIPNAGNITVRQLCNMTSGLYEAYATAFAQPEEANPLTYWDPRDLVAAAVAYPPDFPPGEGWEYSNTNYLILGLIIEEVTGSAVEDEIESRLLKPLGLENTSFPVDYPGMPCPYTHGYTLDEQGSWMDSTVYYSPSMMWTAGVMISDMEDMKEWVKAYATGSTNGEETQEERLDCVDTPWTGIDFGLGIARSAGWYGYTGGLDGYNTAAYYLPGEDATMIVFVNSRNNDPDPGVANAMVRDIAEVVFPDNVPFI
jgi:D-alanyl-D-alanine carboxypeptidase